jgi:hypothetical protein
MSYEPQKKKTQQAQVTVVDIPDGAEVTIEYDDGHVVRMRVAPDSQVLNAYLGLDDVPESEKLSDLLRVVGFPEPYGDSALVAQRLAIWGDLGLLGI